MSSPYGNEAPPPTAPAGGRRRVVVWDSSVRLFHWGLVVLFTWCSLSWRSATMEGHIRAGTLLLGFVLFRLLWGLWGSETARLTPLLQPPRAVWAYLRALRRGAGGPAVGHNPAGGLVVLLFLFLLLAEALSGIVVNNDIANESAFSELMPPTLANALTFLHEALWYALLALTALHVSAIGFYELRRREGLLRAMIDGRKDLPPVLAPPRLASPLRALLTWGLALLLAAGLSAWL